MKTLIISFILAIPFIGFGQNKFDTGWHQMKLIGEWHVEDIESMPKPDTLSAYLLVTTKRMGIAYQKLGFVVRQYGREERFLDCKKQAILPPFNVWNYRLIQKK